QEADSSPGRASSKTFMASSSSVKSIWPLPFLSKKLVNGNFAIGCRLPANTHHNSITLCGKAQEIVGPPAAEKRQREELEARGLWLSLFPVLLGAIAEAGRG